VVNAGAGSARGEETNRRTGRIGDPDESAIQMSRRSGRTGHPDESAIRMNRPSGRIGDPNDSAIRTNRTRASPASGVGGGSLAGS